MFVAPTSATDAMEGDCTVWRSGMHGSHQGASRAPAGLLLLALCLGAGAAEAALLPEQAPDGNEFIILHEDIPVKRGRPKARTVCWLPRGCPYIRGVIVAHPMIAALATDARFRRVAAEEDLGTMLIGSFTWDTAKNWPKLDEALAQWAEASKQPELRGAPVLASGLSASVLMARLLVYERPERCFGIIHVAGGNLHHQYPEGKTLSGVPFIAMNGELESCGPEGGIRPHLGFDTQWYLMGDTMLERRRQDPNHLMGLVVVPCRGHTAWNQELAALFIRKAAKYRLPRERRDGSAPARCVAIRAEDGWLTDRDVKHPRYEPAPYNEYQGDKGQAFWHFDREMALAVSKYHRDGIRPGQARTLFRPAGLLEKLWPLGQRMDIPFRGDTLAEYAAALREWIGAKTGREVPEESIRLIADGIAAGLRKDTEGKAVDEGVCRTVCRRICCAYEDKYQPVAAAIEKAELLSASKALLRAHYGELMLVLWPHGKQVPDLPVRAVKALVAGIPAGAGPEAVKARLGDAAARRAALEAAYGAGAADRPAGMDGLLASLPVKDAQAGWAAAGELAKLGAAAIPELVRVMEYGGPPASFRAAAALGQMGAGGAAALPDLQHASNRGGASEQEAFTAVKALESIGLIEQAKGATR
jgi:hypothetical protein